MEDINICLCCLEFINRTDGKISLCCGHIFHYSCFVSMIEFDKKLSYNNCPKCALDMNVPFPTTKEMKKPKSKEPCSICLEKLGYSFNTNTTTCNHTFHKKCLNTWRSSHNTCPNCRENIGQVLPSLRDIDDSARMPPVLFSRERRRGIIYPRDEFLSSSLLFTNAVVGITGPSFSSAEEERIRGEIRQNFISMGISGPEPNSSNFSDSEI